MSSQPALVVLTGASGAGKTTLLHALDAMRLPGVGVYNFDSMGVPSPEEMERQFGGAAEWQADATEYWIARLLENRDGVEVAVLDGQMRPSVARAILARRGARHTRIVFVNCGHAERNARLRGPRGQPDLANPDMDCWAAYLCGQAHALELPIIDTDGRAVADSAADLVELVRQLIQERESRSG